MNDHLSAFFCERSTMKSYISKMIRLGIILSIVLGAGYFLYVFNQVDKPQLVNTEGRTFERASVVEIIQDNVQENGSRIGDQVVSVRLSSGTLGCGKLRQLEPRVVFEQGDEALPDHAGCAENADLDFL